MELILNTPDGPIEVPSDALLVFVDETGHEKLGDSKYPIFGLGGCVVRADEYFSAIHNPWTSMRQTHFPNRNGPLHATGLRPTPAQAAAIAEVFSIGRFGRIAAVLSDRTSNNTPHTRYQITAVTLLKRVEHIAVYFWPFSKIFFIQESSDRANRLAVRAFGPVDGSIVTGADGQQVQVPFTKLFADKTVGFVGLEVADFIMHAAGKCVYAGGTSDPRARDRRDFQAVFKSAPEHLVSFIEIQTATPGQPQSEGSR